MLESRARKLNTAIDGRQIDLMESSTKRVMSREPAGSLFRLVGTVTLVTKSLDFPD